MAKVICLQGLLHNKKRYEKGDSADISKEWLQPLLDAGVVQLAAEKEAAEKEDEKEDEKEAAEKEAKDNKNEKQEAK